MSYKLIKFNLLTILIYAMSIVVYSMFSSSQLTKNFFGVLDEIASYIFPILFISSIYWLPYLFILWALDELLFFDLNLDTRKAVFIEWMIFCSPCLVSFFQSIPRFNPNVSFSDKCITIAEYAFFYIYLIFVFALSQFYKERYVNRLKAVQLSDKPLDKSEKLSSQTIT